jgi:hypothetical protein
MELDCDVASVKCTAQCGSTENGVIVCPCPRLIHYKASENKVFRKIFGPKKEGESGQCGVLYNIAVNVVLLQ